MLKGIFLIIIISFSSLYSQDILQLYIDGSRQTSGNTGKTLNDAFKGFENLYLDTIKESEIIINVTPGIYYTTNVQRNTQDGLKAMLLIKNKKVKVQTYRSNGSLPPLPIQESTPPSPLQLSQDYAILDGSLNNLDYGIWVYPVGDSNNANNVKIEGIFFTNFKYNGIRVRGRETFFVDGVTIKNCIVTDIVGVEKRNCSAFHISLAKNLIIHNNSVWQDKNNAIQSDGFYIAGVNIITVDNNYMYLKNDNIDSTDTTDHIDGIQFSISEGFYCRDVNVHRNKINNDGSKINTDKYRQGIYLEHVKGFANIFNNLIISKVGSGLIGIDLKSNNALVNIYNNTLHSKGNPGNLIFIKNNALTNVLSSSIKICNNIFYKPYEGSNKNFAMIYLDSLITDEDTSNITFNNIYYCGTQGNPTIQHHYYDQSTFTLYQGNNDPKFEIDTPLNYKIQYSSPAKNNGLGFLANGVVNDFDGNPRPYWNKDFDIGAFEVEDTQLKIALFSENISLDKNVTHTFTTINPYWEKQGNTWLLSSNQQLANTSFTTPLEEIYHHLNDIKLYELKGLQLPWLASNPSSFSKIGAGFYKLTNSNDTSFIYIDLREVPNNYSQNIYLLYDLKEKGYKYKINNAWSDVIAKNTILKLSFLNNGTYNTNGLTNFWENSLVLIKEEKNFYNRPKIIWGSYPFNNSGYNKFDIEKKDGGLDWVKIATLDNNIYSYMDLNEVYYDPNVGYNVKYRVKAINDFTQAPARRIESAPTNEVIIGHPGNNPGKIISEKAAAIPFEYFLSQNYPNPFNPSTEIKFSIKEKGDVVLKVYNIMGKEVSTLINKELEQGQYSVKFDASNLTSGIYFYSIKSRNFSQTKKMILLK